MTVGKERRLRDKSQRLGRCPSFQRHELDRRKLDGGTSTLAGIVLERDALLHALGFPQETSLGRAAKACSPWHYPISRKARFVDE